MGNGKDNWIHKSIEMICKNCMNFCNFRCRKRAPTLNGWPAVYETDWCGDHKLDKHYMQNRDRCEKASEKLEKSEKES